MRKHSQTCCAVSTLSIFCDVKYLAHPSSSFPDVEWDVTLGLSSGGSCSNIACSQTEHPLGQSHSINHRYESDSCFETRQTMNIIYKLCHVLISDHKWEFMLWIMIRMSHMFTRVCALFDISAYTVYSSSMYNVCQLSVIHKIVFNVSINMIDDHFLFRLIYRAGIMLVIWRYF